MTDADLQEAVTAYLGAGRSKAEAARSLGINVNTFKHRLNRAEQLGLVPAETEASEGEPAYIEDRRSDAITLTYVGSRFDTPEEALEYAGIDPDVWEIERQIINGWDVTARIGDGMATKQNKQVKLWLRRKVAEAHVNAFDGLVKRLEKKATKYPKLAKFKPPRDPHLLVVSIFDHHFGKLAWSAETGENYDLKIAEALYRQAVTDLLGKASGYNVGEILFPVGQDLFHIDNADNTTVNGTPQDADGRYGKIIETAEASVIAAIDLCRQVAPVRVMYVPGNHDRTTSYHLCRVLKAWYSREDRVTVDVAPTTRKYHRYGTTLLCSTHGNEEKHAELPMLMANENKMDFAETTHREILVGHWHKKKETRFVPLDTHGGFLVRVMPSMSGCDAWHKLKGYFGGERTAEALLYSESDGYVGGFSTSAGLN